MYIGDDFFMKRMLFLLLGIALVFNLFIFQTESLYEQKYLKASTYILYTNKMQTNLTNCTVVKNGNGSIVFSSFSEAGNIYNLATGVCGEAVEIENTNINIHTILNKLKAKIKSVQQIQHGQVYNCYSKKFSGGLWDNGNKVNLQIAVNQNKIVIGYPLILHGF